MEVILQVIFIVWLAPERFLIPNERDLSQVTLKIIKKKVIVSND